MRYFLILFIFFGVALKPFAQTRENEMYQNAINYLEAHHEEVKQQWFSFLGKNAKDRKYIRERLGEKFEFMVSPLICFLGLYEFNNYLRLDTFKLGLAEDEVLSISKYESKYYFEPFISSSPGLKNASKQKKNSFYIGFSKPVNNFLVAEIVTDSRRLEGCNYRKTGSTIRVLFLYNPDNSIYKTYYSWAIVN